MTKLTTKISGWGNYPISPATVTRPERYHQLKIVEDMTIARGMGRSYGDASLNSSQHVILMTRLNRFLSFDPIRGLLRTEAGISLEEILDTFVPRGWFLPVTPGTKFATLGGSIAADIHGKNHHVDGTLGAHIREIELILADGSHRRCSPSREPDLFWATIGGMGLTGIIAEATLQLIPIESSFISVTHRAAKNLDQVLDFLEDPKMDDKYSVAWIDCLTKGIHFGRSLLMTGHHASRAELPSKIKNPLKIPPGKTLSVPFHCPSWFLNSWSIKAFNSFYYRFQSRKEEPFIADYNHFFYPLDGIQGWNKFYGKRGFLQYQFVVSSQNARKTLHNVLTTLTSNRCAPFLAVLKRFGEEGKGFLSFPRAGYTLALDFPISDSLFPLLDHLDEIVLANEGRIYLAKDARMQPQMFRAMYPRYEKWRTIKTQIDPQNRLSSDLSRRLQMEERS